MDYAECIMNGEPLEAEQLVRILGQDEPLLMVLHHAYTLRKETFGNRVQVHILNNAQNARCSEDCGYCSQSKTSKTPIQPYAWKTEEEILEEGRRAYKSGAYRYCIVGSGLGPTDQRVEFLAKVVERIKREVPIDICCSVGILNEAQVQRLKEAGVGRVNHNLNTSRNHYPKICSTHQYQDRLDTLIKAKKFGLQICSGLIAGMGESDSDLVQVALQLRELKADSIPVNFLIPIQGNALLSDGSLTPERCLRILAMIRFANPTADIRAAAGREGHLRSLEALLLFPANSLFVDGYLTTKGKNVTDTYAMIRDAGFVVERADGSLIPWNELGLTDDYRVDGTKDILKEELRCSERTHRIER